MKNWEKGTFQVTFHVSITQGTGNGFFCGYIGKVVKIIKNYLYSELLGVLENKNSSNLVQNRVEIMKILHYTIVSIYEFI